MSITTRSYIAGSLVKRFNERHPLRPSPPPSLAPDGRKLTIVQRFTPLLLAHAEEMQTDEEEIFREVGYHIGASERERTALVTAIRNVSSPLGAELREQGVYYFVKRWYEPSLDTFSDGHQCIGVLVKRRKKASEAQRIQELAAMFTVEESSSV